MELKPFNIVIWCGNASNQKALANKIAEKFKVSGIVIDMGPALPKKRKPGSIFGILIDRIRFSSIYNAWKNLMAWYEKKYPSWPSTEICKVAGINSKETEEFTKRLRPELIVVSGTGLIREPLLSIPARIGIINLHTGLSPFVKGGPNCTNWCIANNEWQLVGNTIMWLNAGIDSGNIITTETIDIRDAKNLDEVHRRVMEHAHDLYLRAINYLASSTAPFVSIPQSTLGKGNLFLTKMWTSVKRKELLRNWRKRNAGDDLLETTTIPLPN